MCQSLVATTWSQRSPAFASTSEMPAATAAPPETGSEPPSQKSFCTSTMISARDMWEPLSGRDDRDGNGRVAGGELQALPRYRDQALAQVIAGFLQGGQVGDLAAGHERALQQPVVHDVVRHALGDDDLLDGRTRGLVPPDGGLAAADRRLVLGALDHRPALDLDELVDQPGG